MKILFTAPVLNYGGIEILALRFSEAFGRAGHEVTLYDFRPDLRNEQMVSHFDTSKFKLAGMEPAAWKDWLNWKTNAFLLKTGLLKDFRERLIERHFAKFIQRNKFDIVCSISFQQDYFSCKYCPAVKLPVVISMHGTYESDAPYWPERAHLTYEYVSAIIYAADKNLSWFESQPYYQASKPTFKIDTGADLSAPIAQSVNRQDLGIAADAFVFIMVARGIEQKGWQQAIDAHLALQQQHPGTVLLLVGDSGYVQQLRNKYAGYSSILFYGAHPNSLELTQLANVGLLPSYFVSETLPNVIIDYLRCHLPVISTRVGEIPGMLTTPDGQVAGEILPLPVPNVAVETTTLQLAMEKYLVDAGYYARKQALAAQAVRRFDIRYCVEKYLEVFEQVLASPATHRVPSLPLAASAPAAPAYTQASSAQRAAEGR
ncbi:MAG: glycosyltransferase [Hymenobacter sp.]|nr:MAG: glycosyltransferase [Hymenobacter sp.]